MLIKSSYQSVGLSLFFASFFSQNLCEFACAQDIVVELFHSIPIYVPWNRIALKARIKTASLT